MRWKVLGLRTDEWTPGPIMPQSPFRFDPLITESEGHHFTRLSNEVGPRLFPLGQADGGDSYLGMTTNGEVYIGEDRLELLANTGYDALEELVMERHTDAPLPFVPAGDHLLLLHRHEYDMSAEIGTRWSAETDRVLRLAGWYPGRSVSTQERERVLHEEDEGFELHDAARHFLAEFGGLQINQQGPGRTMHRSSFRLDSLVAKWDFEIIDVQSEETGTYLYPIGDAGRGNFYLTMAANGAVHHGMDYVRLLADTGDKALEKLIEGNK